MQTRRNTRRTTAIKGQQQDVRYLEGGETSRTAVPDINAAAVARYIVFNLWFSLSGREWCCIYYFLISCYINPNLKLTCLPSTPFHFCAANLAHQRL